jgi:hypothetical protein
MTNKDEIMQKLYEGKLSEIQTKVYDPEMQEQLEDNVAAGRDMAFNMYMKMLNISGVVRGICVSTMVAIYLAELAEDKRGLALHFMMEAVKSDLERLKEIDEEENEE